jgi:hypothetical protein
MDLAECELLQAKEWCPFNRDTEADESIVDSIATIPLSWILPWAGYRKMSKIGKI